jgi:predicted O-linked N-acetylglucosamine transferase (SPINDLY family)
MKLLKEIPNAVLWLIDDNSTTTENLKNYARKLNVDLTKIHFSTRTAHKDFCARLILCDVYLDTYPYNCGSTSNDVIRNGIPLITKYGPTMVSRMGLSIGASSGNLNKIVQTDTDYIKCVLEIQKTDPKKFNSAIALSISFDSLYLNLFER